MKRSRNVRLVLAAGTLATTTILAGCDGEIPPSENVSFSSVTQCVSQGFPEEACQDEFRAAEQRYLAEAPKFQTAEACQAAFGAEACGPVPTAAASSEGSSGGGGSFMPFMTGFLVSQAFQNMTDRNEYRSYRDRHRDYYSSAGYFGLPPASTGATGPARSFPAGRASMGQAAPASKSFNVSTTGSGRSTQAVTPNTRTSVVATSGFGGRSAIRGGGFSG